MHPFIENLFADLNDLRKFRSSLQNNLSYFSCPMNGLGMLGPKGIDNLIVSLRNEINKCDRRINNINMLLTIYERSSVICEGLI